MKKLSQKGFTLIELLVVIAIIGILSTLAVVSLSGTRQKAYDAQIKSDISNIRTSMALYAENNNGSYSGYNLATADPQFKHPQCGTDRNYYVPTGGVNGEQWAVKGQLCDPGAAGQYFCMDYLGFAGTVASSSISTSTTVCQ